SRLDPASWFTIETITSNAVRLAFLALTIVVLIGVWIVAEAHLREQFLGVPRSTQGLIDPNAGQGALTPDNIERQILTWSLRLRESELFIAAGTDPRPRPFVIIPGEP